MEDDEDVILANSPLNCYLNELNLPQENEDIISEVKCTTNSKISSLLSFCNPKQFIEFIVLDFIESIRDVLKFIDRAILSHPFAFEQFILYKYLEKNVFSSLLIEEDRNFIRNWKTIFVKPTNRFIILKNISVILLMILILNATSIYYNKFKLHEMFSMGVFNNLKTVTAACLFIMCFFTFWLIVGEIFEILYMLYHFKHVLHSTIVLHTSFKQCIKLIQEAEFVSRGFTATSLNFLAEKVELMQNVSFSYTKRQYIEFRKFTFTCLKEMFMAFRNSTINLSDFVPSDSDPDFFHNCLAKLDIKEFGMMLQYDLNSDYEYSELVKITNNFSIPSLKISELVEIQASEFFKSIYLVSFELAQNQPKRNVYTKFIKSKRYRMNVFRLSEKIDVLLRKIGEKYNYYRCFEVKNLNETEQNSKKTENQSPVAVTIHNMSLHLKAALWRLLEIEDKIKVSKKYSFNEKNSAQELLFMLSSVKSEVTSYEDYFNECHTLLTKTLDTEHNEAYPGTLEHKHNESSSYVAQNITEKCNVEPNIQDEVFEDIISDDKRECNEFVDRTFHQQDCQKNIRLLKELKNVLALKASEHEAREKIALAKKQSKISPHSTDEGEENSFKDSNLCPVLQTQKKSYDGISSQCGVENQTSLPEKSLLLENSLQSSIGIKNKTCSNDEAVCKETECSSNLDPVHSLSGTTVLTRAKEDTTESLSDCDDSYENSWEKIDDTHSSEEFLNEQTKISSDKDSIPYSSQKMFQADFNASLKEELTPEKESNSPTSCANENKISCSSNEGPNDNISFVLEQKCACISVGLSERRSTFASAIASMAAQKRQILGLTTEEFVCDYSSSSNSDEED